MAPTIGRIVHFYPAATDEDATANQATVLPALVVNVWEEGETPALNLSVHTDNTAMPVIVRRSIQHKSVVENQKVPEGGVTASYWDWPPKLEPAKVEKQIPLSQQY